MNELITLLYIHLAVSAFSIALTLFFDSRDRGRIQVRDVVQAFILSFLPIVNLANIVIVTVGLYNHYLGKFGDLADKTLWKSKTYKDAE